MCAIDAVAAATALMPMLAPVPAAGEDESSSTAGSRMLPEHEADQAAAEGDHEAPDREEHVFHWGY